MERRWLQNIVTILAGMLLAAGLGWGAFYMHVGEPLERLSYDLPFRFRGENLAAPEIRIVYVDEESAKALNQPTTGTWSRSIHAKLVRHLTQEGARAVFLDYVFNQPSADPAEDESLAAALAENGHVFLGGSVETSNEIRGDGDAFMQHVDLPTPLLRRAAAGYGTVFFKEDPDHGVRQLPSGTEKFPSAGWRLATALGADLPADAAERLAPRWINYYGRTGSFVGVSYHRVFQPDGVAPDYFRDKVVFVGARTALAQLQLGKDEFHVPWTRWGDRYMPGIEVHANSFLNLLHRNWLVRGAVRTEGIFVILVGMIIGGLLARMRPLTAALVGAIFAASTLAGACWYLFHFNVWYNWMVPVAVQTPVAMAWSWAANYFLEARKRGQIRKAFSLYLSPHMADRIASAKFDLSLGGKLIEATMIFTDLEGFTALSEKLGDPKKLSSVLIDYFSNTTRHVLASHGTIIKYIGDAVFAAWNAPLEDKNHAANAVMAAWRMHVSSSDEVQGHKLVTRVGINTGEVLAGNLGSEFRFDYTLIGDPVNFASRLEGLNKFLGTEVLMSQSTREQIGSRFITRELGSFLVVGKTQPVTVHELLGLAEDAEERTWAATFTRALECFRKGDLGAAELLFEQAKTERAGRDGPSSFYLKTIAGFHLDGQPADWSGAVEITSK